MILDERLEFADAVSVVGSAGTALIGDVIDTQESTGDMSTSENLYLVVRVSAAIVTAAAAGTFQITLASSNLVAIPTNGTATVSFAGRTFATGAGAAGIAAGTLLAVIKIPMINHLRYMGVLATIGTTAVSAGSIDAFLTTDVARWKAYADGQN